MGKLKGSKAPKKRRGKKKTAISVRDEINRIKLERIIAEAVDLFYEVGYRQTAVSDIAKQLGVTKPYVYYHFQNKIDLLVEICERSTRDALEAVARATSSETTPLNKYVAFVRAFTEVVLKDYKFVSIYFREELNLPPESIRRINAMRKEVNKRLFDILSDGIASGDFEVEDPGMSALVIAGMSSYAFAWYRQSGRLELKQIVEDILRMAVKLVLPAG